MNRILTAIGTLFAVLPPVAYGQGGSHQNAPMVETSGSLWIDLDEEQRQRAKAIHVELLPVYGDEVAVERTARYMEREKRKMTGSRTGFIGTLRIHTRDGKHYDGESLYADERWDYRRLIEPEARIFDELTGGKVEVGEMDAIEGTDR